MTCRGSSGSGSRTAAAAAAAAAATAGAAGAAASRNERTPQCLQPCAARCEKFHSIHVQVSMPSSQPCQVCRRHRSRWRRTCLDCRPRVSPGCVPERCLVEDFGDYTGVCRPCAVRRHDRRIVANRLHPPVLLQGVLFGELSRASWISLYRDMSTRLGHCRHSACLVGC